MAMTLAACATADPDRAEPDPVFGGATVSFLTDEVAQVIVASSAGTDTETLKAYADCALAEAMELNGTQFARHVRTLTSEEAGIARADAVYTMSNARPDGDFVLDGAETRAACAEKGIPGV